jgi:large subunit ribosomal protein L25
MHRLQLEVTTREETGKGAARRTRRAGQVPAVLYGAGIEPVSLRIDRRTLERVVHSGANTLLDLRGPDSVKGKIALVKELQRDPLSREAVHCDLHAIDTRKKLHVSIPLHFAGKPAGVEMGGVLDILARELEIVCLPMIIPDSIDIDVSALEIGDAIHVRDLPLAEGIEVVTDSALTLVHVVPPRVDRPAAAEGEGAAAAEGGAA